MELTAQLGRPIALTPTQIEARNRRLKFHLSIQERAAQTQAAKASEAAAKLARRNLLQEVSKREAPPVFSVPAPEILVYPVIPEEGPKVVRPTIAGIQAEVADYFGVTVNDLTSQRRSADIILPRQVGYYLSRELTQFSMPVIGKHFGFRDHTSVLSGIRKIKRLLLTDTELAFDVATLFERITVVMQ